jgi:hypothetical protein
MAAHSALAPSMFYLSPGPGIVLVRAFLSLIKTDANPSNDRDTFVAWLRVGCTASLLEHVRMRARYRSSPYGFHVTPTLTFRTQAYPFVLPPRVLCCS